MKKGRWLVVGLLCGALFTAGCGKELSTDEFKIDSSEDIAESSSELDGANLMRETIGTVSHGVNWAEDEEDYAFVYSGGELDIPYGMHGSGIGTSVGFLLYLDGIPQPYKIKDVDEEYKYMHVIEGEENADTEFVISFIPVTGKAGDKVKLSINSIANPSFIPDMVNTFDYGMSHQSLEAVYDISFEQDAETTPKAADELCIMNQVSNQKADIDKEEEAYIQENSLEEKLDLDTNIYQDLIMDDNSMLLDSKLDIKGKNTVHISYIMMGHPGVKYKVSFYLNHQLLTEVSKDSYEIELTTGKMNTIEFDLDVSEVTDGTFYVVAVPINADDYPEDGIGTIKYPSIHLYSAEETLSQIDDVTNVAYIAQNRLLVVADQMYLIDAESGKVEAKTAECDYAKGEIKVYSNDEEIIIIGEQGVDVGEEGIVFYDSDDEDAPKETVLYYDYDLNITKKINIYECFGINPNPAQYVAVSKDGKLAAYDEERRELYLCDLDTGEKKKILGGGGTELVYDNKIQFSISGGIEFAKEDERIVFTAGCLDYPLADYAVGTCGVGSVSLDGKEYYVEKVGDEYSEMATYNDYSILSQDCGFTSPAGKVAKYIFESDSIKRIDLATKEESSALYCSDQGNIIATSEENEEKGWKLRFYDAGSGKILKEQKLDKWSSETYREPKIYVFEELNAAIAFFKSVDESSRDEFTVIKL